MTIPAPVARRWRNSQLPGRSSCPLSMPELKTARGRCLPLGAMAMADGVNFSVLCKHGTAMSLVLLPETGPGSIAEVPLDPRKHRTGDHWHVLVHGLPPTFRYGWRVDGPTGRGHRF